jgi:uncharacterized repeat protein (TIGR04076 family)
LLYKIKNRRDIMDQDIYKIKIKVTSQKGKCEAGHKVGDEFEAAGLTPPGMCIFAFSSILPSLTPLMFGGQFFWAEDKDVTRCVCPDGENPVEFELRRVRKAEK